jgi:FkbM family methyltransferase
MEFTFGGGASKIKLIDIKDDPITLASKNRISGFEPFSIQVWKKLCQEEDINGIIWDVGAFIGVYGLIAAKASQDNRVYCFEPSGAPFYRMLGHIHLNELWGQIFPLKIALSDQTTVVQLYHPFGWYVLGSGDNLSNLYSTSYFREDVKLETADNLVHGNRFYELEFTHQVPQIGAPSLIKVDIEGHEINFLRGCVRTLSTSKPVIIIEILSAENLYLVQKELCEYKWVSINEISKAFSNRPNFDIEGSNNFLFCHKDRIVQVSEVLESFGELNWN